VREPLEPHASILFNLLSSAGIFSLSWLDTAKRSQCLVEHDRGTSLQSEPVPPLWNVCCDAEPTPKGARYPNLPTGASVDPINPLTTPAPQDFWNWYGMLLRTTRQRQFDKKLKESGKQFRTKTGKTRKRFMAHHKAQVVGGLRPTTIFDFLYRLRVRSNYEDADAFILGTMSQADAEEFNSGLCTLTSTTLFLLELHIAARIGGPNMGQFVDEFTQADRPNYSRKTIGVRKSYLS
jgi:hypothetical protein